MSETADERERKTEERIQVRRVTRVQVSWTEQERGAHGAFTIQLVLDDGAEEYVLRPTPEDAHVVLRLFERTGASFDLARKVLIFDGLPPG